MDNGRQILASTQTRNGHFQLEAVIVDGQTHHVLSVNGCVMARSQSNLETALADLALCGIPATQRYADVLIGGLGLGLTLRQVLKHRAVQSVCVIEIEPRIVAWNSTYLNNADLLNDARVELVMGDFCEYVRAVPRNYHGIAMHIDTGRDRVASLSLLRVLQTRLRTGGALALCAGQATYDRALQAVFSAVNAMQPDSDSPCTIYQVMA